MLLDQRLARVGRWFRLEYATCEGVRPPPHHRSLELAQRGVWADLDDGVDGE
jgi:hypothetical protein